MIQAQVNKMELDLIRTMRQVQDLQARIAVLEADVTNKYTTDRPLRTRLDGDGDVATTGRSAED